MSRKNFKKRNSSKDKEEYKKEGSNNPKKSTNAKTNEKTYDKGQEVDADKTAEEKTNDPAWYSANPQLIVDAASLPFAYPLGGNTRLTADNHYGVMRQASSAPVEVTVKDVSDVLPGLCTLYTRGTLGCSVRSSDPVNMAAVALYTQVRYVNSGRKNYDAPDLMMYLLGATDLYAFTFWCKRLYGAAFVYSQSNLYLGRSVLAANGVDPEDFKRNLANFRLWLNTFIHRVTSYAIPSTMPLFAQRVFQYSGLYIESDSNIKDQMYMYAPTAFYKFKLDENDKGMLDTTFLFGDSVTFPWNHQLSVSQIMNFGEDLLASFWGDEDFTIMSGDVYKAFEGHILGMEDQAPDAMLVPVKDDMVLAQMRNATIVGQYVNHLKDENGNWHLIDSMDDINVSGADLSGVKPGSIYQTNDGRIVSVEVLQDEMQYGLNHDPVAAWNNSVWATHYPKYLNLRDDTSPGVVIEATRLMFSSHPGSVIGVGAAHYTDAGGTIRSNRSRLQVIDCGVSLVQYAAITTFKYEGSRELETTAFNGNYLTIINDEAGTYEQESLEILDMLKEVGQFHNFPNLYKVEVLIGTGNEEVKSVEAITNIDNFSIVTSNMLSRMHSVALLSLLYTAGIAHIVDSMKEGK